MHARCRTQMCIQFLQVHVHMNVNVLLWYELLEASSKYANDGSSWELTRGSCACAPESYNSCAQRPSKLEKEFLCDAWEVTGAPGSSQKIVVYSIIQHRCDVHSLQDLATHGGLYRRKRPGVDSRQSHKFLTGTMRCVQVLGTLLRWYELVGAHVR